VSFAGALSPNNLHGFERLAFYLGAAPTQTLSSSQGRMTSPDTFVDLLVDEEASDPVKDFCEASCELNRTKIAADTDQRLAIGDLLCPDRHRHEIQSPKQAVPRGISTGLVTAVGWTSKYELS
jgi:hypothetical protein